MISRPVAARPSYSGRRASLLQRDAGSCRALLKRLRRASLCALSLYLSFVIVTAAGEKGKDAAQPVNLFLDVASNQLADEVDMSKKRRLNLAGVPIVVAGKRQDGAAPSVAAGIAGSYNFDLGNNMSLKSSGTMSRTHVYGDGVLSSGQVGGDVALRYQRGGSGLLLRPSAYATMQRDVLERMDYALDSKLWEAIGHGIDLTASLGHSERVSELLYTDNRNSTYGSLGFEVDLFGKNALALAYGFNTTEGTLPSQFRFDQGPSLTTHLNLAPGWRLDGSYGLTATQRGYTDEDAGARRHDMHHLLNLKSEWKISSTTGAEWQISADYNYDRTLTDAPNPNPASHIGSVNFALNF
jgi:hypothetical protein